MKKPFIILFLCILPVILFGCMSQIAEIKKNPYVYNGKEISVYGTIDKVKIFEESSIFNTPSQLYLYTIKDNFDEISIISTKIPYKGQNKKVYGKLIVFKKNLYENEVQFIINELAMYLAEKNALPSSKQKEAQKAFVSIIASIINLLTNNKMSEPVNTVSEGAQAIIDSRLEESDIQYINEIVKSLLNFLPKDEYYFIILEK